MARTQSISLIDMEIVKVGKDLAKVQIRYDALAVRLLELQYLNEDYEIRQILEAFHRNEASRSIVWGMSPESGRYLV